MDNVVSFSSASKEYEAAAEWIARLDRGLEGHERQRLAEWLKGKPANADALLELAALWDQLDLLSELGELFPLDRPVRKRKEQRTVRWALAAAASLLASTIALWVYFPDLPGDSGVAELVPFDDSLETAVGQLATQELPDGSVFMLNTDTQLEVRMTDASRTVDLERGEAYFDVAPDADRPFVVRAGGRSVQAVGTAFNVRLENNGQVEVTVTEGTVEVLETLDERSRQRIPAWLRLPRPGARSVASLVEGQIALLEVDGTSDDPTAPQIRRLDPAELDMKLAWQRGMLIFSGETLATVIAEVSRYTTIELVLEDSELEDVRVGGYFQAGDIEGLLATLHDSFRIDADRVSDDRIVLRPQE